MQAAKLRASWSRVQWGRWEAWSRSLPAVLMAILAAVVVGSLVAPPPAAAAGNGLFSIEPTSPPGSRIGRPFFSPVLEPGVPAHDSVTVVNLTAQPITLDLYAAQGFTTSDGGFGLQPSYKPKLDMGAWIHLPVSSLTVPGRSGTIVPFTYEVPANTPSGDYAGGIVAEQTVGTTTKNGSVRVTKLLAVGARVYGRVSGPLHPNLAVTSVQIKVHTSTGSEFGGGVDSTVTYSITNTGNENLTPVATVSLSPLLGGSPAADRVHLPQVLPQSTITFSHTFDGVIPFGQLSATVAVSAPGVRVSGSTSAVVIPWGIVGILVLLVIVLVVWDRRRRRRHRPAPATSGATLGGRATIGGAGAPMR